MNTLHLSDDETVEQHIQTNDSAKHLNETSQKTQEVESSKLNPWQKRETT